LRGAVAFLGRLGEQLARAPGISAINATIPRNGRYPRWAYVALPAAGLLIAMLLLLLLIRPKRAPLEEAPAAIGVPEVPRAEAVAAPADSHDVAAASGGLDAAGWRINLRNAARQKEWGKGAEAVLTLLKLAPAMFKDHDVQNEMRSVAFALEQDGGEPSDKFFNALTNETGTDGLDLLYDISRFRPGTKAGKRATDILRRPEVMARASTPLKVLFDFREASCMAKRDMFGRLGDQGDDRALFELQALSYAECRDRKDWCCFKENRTLSATIKALKTRLGADASASP
jgi:serine/threonine-protein kinase